MFYVVCEVSNYSEGTKFCWKLAEMFLFVLPLTTYLSRYVQDCIGLRSKPIWRRLYSAVNLHAFACQILFCVLRLTNIGFVQCFSLGPLWSLYACVCRVMLCVLRLTNIGFVQCFSLGSLLSLHAYVSRFVMQISPHKLRDCAVLAPRFPLEFRTRVFLRFACFASQTPGLCSAFPFGPFWVCTLAFVTFCYVYFALQTSGLCSAFLSVPFWVCTLMCLVLLHCALVLLDLA